VERATAAEVLYPRQRLFQSFPRLPHLP
jgi:hypothetical protein